MEREKNKSTFNKNVSENQTDTLLSAGDFELELQEILRFQELINETFFPSDPHLSIGCGRFR